MLAFDLRSLVTQFDSDATEHEQVVLFQDPASDLKGFVAVHSTALGPALGGVRFHSYADEGQALADVLRLSRGMSYKNALAGLDFGGGKAVLIGDPERIKTEELLLAYGRFVASLEGRYVTACDVGTTPEDMEVIASTCSWTATRPMTSGGSGDPSVFTARSVLQGMKAAAVHRWGTPALQGRTVGIAGVGKVGRLLVEHLFEEGARVVVTDVRAEAVRRIAEKFPETTVVEDTKTLIRLEGLDVYAPCALGGALSDDVVPLLTAEVVCGAANNQLAHPGVERRLKERGILYLPDYVVNAGGVIQAAGGLRGATHRQTVAKVDRIFDTTLAILERAEAENILPGTAADRIAEQRIARAAHARTAAGSGQSIRPGRFA
ncbi:Glu/Leu/Phe/Val dehydrogenase dimerization domain-containing protein [Streptomyces sp. CSDS2]|uniref:Glu/Leu/Phe/Val family dehydrogenase n=1 Tax=Streptomyces sp. CSDS2 TaxID=3055051 RepID=UPI0025B00474|nr:Glu/Leu/Phe/Val dehydrogenase dimerization domain-containing protein [Streptomyces sp. CSDS2]MDN3263619.1 Glu/Leu/Phe/Val dehydrogenase dimerization domain-containing protein [Streptomyces sp. CSDS2]